jgi:hypothetical protein
LFIFRETRHFRSYRRLGPGRIFNGGFDVRIYQRRVGRPPPVFRLNPVDSLRDHGTKRGPGSVDVFRPRITTLPKGEPRRLPPRFLDLSPDKRGKGAPAGPRPQVKSPIDIAPKAPSKDGPPIGPGGVKQGKVPSKLEPAPRKDGPTFAPGAPKQGKAKLEQPPKDKGPVAPRAPPYVKATPPEPQPKSTPGLKSSPQFREKAAPPPARTPQAGTPAPRAPLAKEAPKGKPAAKKKDKDKSGPGQ